MRCPQWCVVDHRSERDRSAPAQHYSTAAEQVISLVENPSVSQRFEIGLACVELDEPWADSTVEIVELAHYKGDRYSVTALTSTEARGLGMLLLAAADQADQAATPAAPKVAGL